MSRARRAKQSKMPKKILLTLALITGVTGTLAVNGTKINKSSMETLRSKVNTYEANEFVKEIFTAEDGTRYLPIVYQDAYDQITKSEIESKFKVAGIEIESISPETIGTGTKIKTKNATYTVLIYGDVDGNGTVNIRDVNKIIRTLLYDEEPPLTGINALAANVQDLPEKPIDIRDVHRIVEFLLERNTIIDKKDIPESDILRDKEAPVIKMLGDNPLLVRLNGEYKDPGIEVTDNLDPNVKWTANPTTIDTSKPGKYNIIYTATDASGNTATAVRIVEVEDELAPVITLNDPRENIYINVNDEETFNKIDLGATAADEKEDDIKVKIVGIDKVNVKVPGVYPITYTAVNSQGNEATPIERKIEVINYVTDMAVRGNISKTQFKEDEEIDLEGVTVDITRAYGAPVTKTIAELKSEEENDNKYYEIKMTPFSEGIATYNEANDVANANIDLTLQCIFNNPADKTKVESNTRRVGYVTVIGQIREFVKVTDPSFETKTSGIIYDPINVIKVTTKRYQEELSEDNLEVTLTSRDGDISTAHTQINFTDGGAEIKIWAVEPGTYTVVLDAGKAESSRTNITITETNTVDEITLGNEGKPFEGILKAGGDYKDIPVSFTHNYGSSETEEISRPVKVTANRITFTKDSDIEKYKFLGIKDGSIVELSETDKTTPVTAIRIWAKAGVVPAGQDRITRVLEVEVDKGTSDAPTPKTINISIYPDSEYKVTFKEDSLKIYLQNEGAENTYIDEDGTIYTLLEIQKVDQYENHNDPKYISATAGEISNLEATISSGNIVFVDSACKYDTKYAGNPFIKVAGFIDRKIGGYTKVSSGNIKYVGIALEDVIDVSTKKSIGDEDIRLEQEGKIYVYHGNDTAPRITLEISEIVKKDITTMRAENLVKKEFCYEETKIVELKSGYKQKPLEAGKIAYEVYKDGKRDNTVEITEGTVENGTVNVMFKAPNAGTYQIKATLTQNGKTTTLTTEDILIEENPIVTRVAFRTRGNTTEKPSTNFGIVRIGKTVIKDIVYIHDYTDKEGNPILDEDGNQVSGEIEKANIPIYEYITLPERDDIEINLYNGNYNLSEKTDWTNAPVDGISIKVKSTATPDTVATFTINIDNSKYAEYGGKTENPVSVRVSIGEPAEIAGITLKPVRSDGKTINLYMDGVPVEGSGEKTTTYLNDKYTLFEISYIDVEGDELEILDASEIAVGLKNASGTPSIWFADDVYIAAPEDGAGIQIAKFQKDGENYKPILSGNFDYLGINVFDDTITSLTVYYKPKGTEQKIPVAIDGVVQTKARKAREIKASVQKTVEDPINPSINNNTQAKEQEADTNITNSNTITNEVTNSIANTVTNEQTTNTVQNEINNKTENTVIPENKILENVTIPEKQDEE